MTARRGSVLIEAVVATVLIAAALVIASNALGVIASRADARRTGTVQAAAARSAVQWLETFPYSSYPPVGTAAAASFDTVAITAVRRQNRPEDGKLVPAFEVVVRDARAAATGRADTVYVVWNPLITDPSLAGYNRRAGLNDLRP